MGPLDTSPGFPLHLFCFSDTIRSMPAHRLVRVVRQAFTVDDSLFNSPVAGRPRDRSISSSGTSCVAGTPCSQSFWVERRSDSPGPARVVRAVPCRSNVSTSMAAPSPPSSCGRLPAPLSELCRSDSAVPQGLAQSGLGPVRYDRKARIVQASQGADRRSESNHARMVVARPHLMGERRDFEPAGRPHLAMGERRDFEPSGRPSGRPSGEPSGKPSGGRGSAPRLPRGRRQPQQTRRMRHDGTRRRRRRQTSCSVSCRFMGLHYVPPRL